MKISEERVQKRLPLTPAVFHILLALADADLHGYGIMKEVAERTGSKIQMGPGTLYGTLQRMQKDGLVVEAEELSRGEIGDDRRRYYRMTPLGKAVAMAEAARLEELLAMARSKQLAPVH